MNKKLAKVLALLVVLTMSVAMLAGCSKPAESTAVVDSTSSSDSTVVADPTASNDTLVVGYSYFSGKFSPFFAKTQYDMDVANIVSLVLLGADREGNMVLKGIEGETRAYNGTDYTYGGIADCDIVQNDDGTTDYNITMRDDIVFSDGTPMTINDVIFSMYVMCDPTFDGSATFYGLPIVGMDEYRAGMSTLSSLILQAGRDNTDFTLFTEEQAKAYWDAVDSQGAVFVQEIIDYCVAADPDTLAACNDNEVAVGMIDWGYGALNDDGTFTDAAGTTYDLTESFPTVQDYLNLMMETYNYDIVAMSDTESAGSDLPSLIATALGDDASSYDAGVKTGDSADSITGIEKTGDYSMTLHMTSYDATAVYNLNLAIAPLHYYGNPDMFDYDNNSFGFTKGDLSGVRAKTTTPLGAGPYKFVSYENGVVTFEANENYYLGAPKTKNLLFRETADGDKLSGMISGTFDIAEPSFNNDNVEAIKGYNSNGELTGDIITTSTVENLGYGYLGICADNVKVGNDKASDASKALRTAFATLFAANRATAIESYYGDRAQVINYPISNTSWAAPKVADEGYQIAYSTDVDGNNIYTDDMTADEMSDAALQAAIGFFKAAGYTWDDATSTFTAAPEGASMTYEVIIPGDGTGDHPGYGILTTTKEQLSTIGITLEINDPTDSNVLWNATESGTAEMWCAAWQATPDPDMYQVYHSSNVVGAGGTDSNTYGIADPTLDSLILEGRASADNAFRKATYKECLEIIMDWGVEVPLYQRLNALIFSTERVNIDTLTPDITTFWGWANDIEKLEMN